MSYKPKYCCHCGEAIERNKWKIWTSRRFCELCETEFVMSEWLPKIGSGIGLIISVLFIGGLLQTSDKSAVASPMDQSKNLRQSANINKQEIDKENVLQSDASSSKGILSATPLVQIQTNKENIELDQNSKLGTQNARSKAQQNLSEGNVYYCGAETKKGTPCTRHIKGGGRCWQHQGKDAMLPENQLLVGR